MEHTREGAGTGPRLRGLGVKRPDPSDLNPPDLDDDSVVCVPDPA